MNLRIAQYQLKKLKSENLELRLQNKRLHKVLTQKVVQVGRDRALYIFRRGR